MDSESMRNAGPTAEIILANTPPLPPLPPIQRVDRDKLVEWLGPDVIIAKPRRKLSEILRPDPFPTLFGPEGGPTEGGPTDVSQGPDVRFLQGWEYSGPAGQTSHENSKIEAWANAGRLAGAGRKPDEVITLEWVGRGLFASQTTRVRVTPGLTVWAIWSLMCAGTNAALVGEPPTAHLQGEVQLQAYDSKRSVSPLQVVPFINDSFSATPGDEIATKRGEGGLCPVLHAEFTIPGGQVRWVNVLLRLRGYANDDGGAFQMAGVDCMATLDLLGLTVQRI